jgi:bacterioferritin
VRLGAARRLQVSSSVYEAFLTDVLELRRRSRRHVTGMGVAGTRRSRRETTIELLNDALATELVCALRYKRQSFFASGLASAAISREFCEHAADEQRHAERIAERIGELGGVPVLEPKGLVTTRRTDPIPSAAPLDVLEENLTAKRVAIDELAEIARFVADDDPKSRRLLEEIILREEAHAEDLLRLLSSLDFAVPPEAAE